jgi:hypothetical protein
MGIGFAKKKEIRGWIILDSSTELKRNINFTKELKRKPSIEWRLNFKKSKNQNFWLNDEIKNN